MNFKKPNKDKYLFTPGPLTTSSSVKQAMLRDLGSRDYEFIQIIKHIREALVVLCGATIDTYTTVLMQGSGTFGLEAMISSTIPPEGELLFIVNGAYGDRIIKIATILGIPCHKMEVAENAIPEIDAVAGVLDAHPGITHVGVVHCETTTGIVNPVQEIGMLVKERGKTFLVDAMSSFGGMPLNVEECGIDFMVTSPNKCLEGVPGFSIVLARIETLQATRGYARSLSLDLYDQWQGFNKNGQFRFTPPTHALLAFDQALKELVQEGGIEKRIKRYRTNYLTLREGMRRMGFEEYLDPRLQGHIITSYLYPTHPKFDFNTFYEQLNQRGFVIYPGKVSTANCFRIGNIGRIYQKDVLELLTAIEETLAIMEVSL